jgi:hypothetical protein
MFKEELTSTLLRLSRKTKRILPNSFYEASNNLMSNSNKEIACKGITGQCPC